MKSFFEYLLVYVFGAIVYSCLEILFRGFTHWTMFLAGGVCYTILYHIYTVNNRRPLWKNCLLGALVITGVELIFGCFFNLALGWKVWDYSNYPFHLWGQICLPYTLLWFALSAPIVWLAKSMKKASF